MIQISLTDLLALVAPWIEQYFLPYLGIVVLGIILSRQIGDLRDAFFAFLVHDIKKGELTAQDLLDMNVVQVGGGGMFSPETFTKLLETFL